MTWCEKQFPPTSSDVYSGLLIAFCVIISLIFTWKKRESEADEQTLKSGYAHIKRVGFRLLETCGNKLETVEAGARNSPNPSTTCSDRRKKNSFKRAATQLS